MNIEPNVGKVLVKLDEEAKERKSKGGILMPDSAIDDTAMRTGTVVAAGRATPLPGGGSASMTYCVQDRVILDPLGGVKMKIDGVPHVLVRDVDVMGKVN